MLLASENCFVWTRNRGDTKNRSSSLSPPTTGPVGRDVRALTGLYRASCLSHCRLSGVAMWYAFIKVFVASKLYSRLSSRAELHYKSSSFEVDSRSASQILRFVWDTKVVYRVHKVPPLDPEPD